MTIRSILLAAIMAVSAQAVADEAANQAAQEVASKPLSYCEQLGKTAGFEGEDLKDFIGECSEKRQEEGKKDAE